MQAKKCLVDRFEKGTHGLSKHIESVQKKNIADLTQECVQVCVCECASRHVEHSLTIIFKALNRYAFELQISFSQYFYVHSEIKL